MNTYLEKLEYNKILEKLSENSITYLGRNLCNNLLPSNNQDEVKNMLAETEEAVNLIYRCRSCPTFRNS